MAVPRLEQLSPVQADPVLSAKVNPIPEEMGLLLLLIAGIAVSSVAIK